MVKEVCNLVAQLKVWWWRRWRGLLGFLVLGRNSWGKSGPDVCWEKEWEWDVHLGSTGKWVVLGRISRKSQVRRVRVRDSPVTGVSSWGGDRRWSGFTSWFCPSDEGEMVGWNVLMSDDEVHSRVLVLVLLLDVPIAMSTTWVRFLKSEAFWSLQFIPGSWTISTSSAVDFIGFHLGCQGSLWKFPCNVYHLGHQVLDRVQWISYPVSPDAKSWQEVFLSGLNIIEWWVLGR